ncbi:adenylosuccinate synthetase [Afifella aestuarii]|uniref:adenylosuccinate synthetase n=1 Tax=Afifella aestuarii TaxID=1909496 RepID=UPI0013E30D72|nr:adenylosuccinate synthetase [Afifella aestuarii]
MIGASYGDEGKGRTVDWLAASSGPKALVVRSNGGAQAGHTVETPKGRRHVFHHVGSGTFRGARTHLSRYMVSHPILFAEEVTALSRHLDLPAISADPRGFVTTPFDMMVNQAAELARDGARHGSCGLGFGETVGRCETGPYALTVADLYRPGLKDRLIAIREEWLPKRLEEMDLRPGFGPLAFASSRDLLDCFVAQCTEFARRVGRRDDPQIGEEDTVIFEAAQGLLLDQNASGFPFVTRSKTGLANISAIAAEAGIESLDAIFASRCYLTRHGRGPMEDERPIKQWYALEDPTNQPNPWQETMRHGLIDPAKLADRIALDLARSTVPCRASLAMTCLDQAKKRFVWLSEGEPREGTEAAFLGAMGRATGLPLTVCFSSPRNEWHRDAIRTSSF